MFRVQRSKASQSARIAHKRTLGCNALVGPHQLGSYCALEETTNGGCRVK
jgi:hypothetical protein